MATNGDDLTSDHLSWLVQSRNDNQIKNLQLFGMFDLYKEKLRLKDHSLQAQALVAIGFSLWRSVFLADKSTEPGAPLSDATYFLGKVIVDNAINYPQDRKARDWTFNYYIANAKMRLEQLESDWNTKLFGARRLADDPRERWGISQNAYAKALNHFDSLLRN